MLSLVNCVYIITYFVVHLEPTYCPNFSNEQFELFGMEIACQTELYRCHIPKCVHLNKN